MNCPGRTMLPGFRAVKVPLSSCPSASPSPALRSALAGVALLALTGPASPRREPDGFADLAAKLLPAVVNISTTQTLPKADRQRPRDAAIPARLALRGVLQGLLRQEPAAAASVPRRSRRGAPPRSAPASSSTRRASSSPTTTSSPTPTRSPSSCTTTPAQGRDRRQATPRPTSPCCSVKTEASR